MIRVVVLLRLNADVDRHVIEVLRKLCVYWMMETRIRNMFHERSCPCFHGSSVLAGDVAYFPKCEELVS